MSGRDSVLHPTFGSSGVSVSLVETLPDVPDVTSFRVVPRPVTDAPFAGLDEDEGETERGAIILNKTPTLLLYICFKDC